MSNERLDRAHSAAVFADPVGYLGSMGIEAVVVSSTVLADAA